jgi:hypothetical protein
MPAPEAHLSLIRFSSSPQKPTQMPFASCTTTHGDSSLANSWSSSMPLSPSHSRCPVSPGKSSSGAKLSSKASSKASTSLPTRPHQPSLLQNLVMSLAPDLQTVRSLTKHLRVPSMSTNLQTVRRFNHHHLVPSLSSTCLQTVRSLNNHPPLTLLNEQCTLL